MERLVLILASVFATFNFVACTTTPTTTPPPACSLAASLTNVAADSLASPIIAALYANNYFDTIEAINAAGGYSIYAEDGPEPKTIFTPTQAGWTALATSLGYASTDSMLCQMPKAKIKAILQYNCLPTLRSSADIASSSAMPTCLINNGTNEILNVDNDPATVAIRDAACTVIPLRYPNILSGDYILHGTDRPAIPPNTLPVIDMLRSNPFLATETLAFGSAPEDLLVALGGLNASFTIFVPTTAGLASAITSIGPTDLGLTQAQIASLLRYQVITPAITTTTAGLTPTFLTGQSVTINTNGAPVVQTSISTDFTTIPPVKILQANNVGSDGNNIYCVDTVLFPKVPFCAEKPDTTTAIADCTAAATTAETCAAVKLASGAGAVPISVSACAFTAATCNVNTVNEANNCATYGAGEPTGGTVCMQHPDYCSWVPATPPDTIGSCNPIGGAGADVDACAAYISGNVIADRANCNSALDPEFSMCTYSAGTCDPATSDIATTCAALVNSDCVAAPTTTQSNADFCSLQ